jgi:hypothetical protein
VPVVDDPAQPRRRILTGDDGEPLAHFEVLERDGRPMADFFTPADGVAPDRAAAAAVEQLRGWRVAGPPAMGRLLIAAGAKLRRHAHVFTRDLVRDPAPPDWLEPALPPGYRLAAADRPASDLAAACVAAYPADHPDHDELPDRPERELDDLLSGRLLGPLLRCSGLVVRDDGTVAGAVLVNAEPGDPPLAGPWISQVFRHPDAAGTGGPLLRRTLALATRDGLPALGLAVTHANPARAVYAALGFTEAFEAYSVEVGSARAG